MEFLFQIINLGIPFSDFLLMLDNDCLLPFLPIGLHFITLLGHPSQMSLEFTFEVGVYVLPFDFRFAAKSTPHPF